MMSTPDLITESTPGLDLGEGRIVHGIRGYHENPAKYFIMLK
jgi:hypothetical protein